MFNEIRKIQASDMILSFVALWGIAIAKPVLDVVGKTPEYWVANRIDIFTIIFLTLALAIILPAIIGGIFAIVRRNVFFRGASQILFCFLFTILSSIAVYHSFSFTFGKTVLLAVLSVMVSVLILCLYCRYQIARQFFFVFSIISLLIPIEFLFFSPTRALVVASLKTQDEVKNTVSLKEPVVFVVFDELSLASLINADGMIDGRLFPNFKRLAGKSTWYKNATTNYGSTETAVPTLLTGRFRKEGVSETSYKQNPSNLFTLIHAPDGVLAMEPLTDLCPPSVCSETKTMLTQQLKQVWFDFWLIYKNVIVPDIYASKVQHIPKRFKELVSFVNNDHSRNVENENGEGIGGRTDVGGLIGKWFRKGHSKSLVFIHYELPHAPYTMNPNGTRYTFVPDYRMIGWTSKDHSWDIRENFYVTQAYQRYLLQAMYADRKLGEIIDSLEENEVFDSSTIVVTVDHGVGFTPGGKRRNSAFSGSIDENAENVAVPLFWKSPWQKLEKQSLCNVESIDILPSLLEELGDGSSQQVMDGKSIFSAVERKEKKFGGTRYSKDVWSAVLDTSKRLNQKINIFQNINDTYFPQQEKYSKFIGLQVGETLRSDIVVEVDNSIIFKQLKDGANQDICPNFIEGAIENNSGIDAIGISINDTLVDVVELSSDEGGRHKFVSIFNPIFLKGNNNKLDFLSMKFHKSGDVSYSVLQMEKNIFSFNNNDIIDSKGKKLKRNQNRLFGAISFDNRLPGVLGIGGWVADRNTLKPPVACLVSYEGDQHLFKTTVFRPDLAKLGQNMVRSGFTTSIRLKNMMVDYKKLRIFAIFDDDTYAEFKNVEGIQ